MSYEGYDQCICKNGHYFARDCRDESNCPHCSAEMTWYNSVDETNGENAGLIPFSVLEEKFSVVPGKIETCSLGHTHIVQQEIFRIPSRSETDPLRTYRPLEE